MKCPQCGTNNEKGFKFCVKCGTNLENPQDINIEQVDMGGYHSEEDSATGGFTLGSGTFTINDTSSRDSSSDLYTAAELNDTDEEFDFSSFDDIDEPFIPKLDTGRVTLPEQTKAVRQAQMQNAGGMRPQGMMQGIPQPQGMMQGIPQPQGVMQGIPQPQGVMQGIPQPQGMMQGIPQPQGAASPQGNGQQMNGMPVYGQPVMYAQPQLIGYDQNGMPVYGQPVMYQPQLIGYDQNGMPVYGQPVMYSQPQIIGYDQNGMPVYGQPMMYAQPQMGELPEGAAPNAAGMQAVPNMGGIPGAQFAQKAPVPPSVEDKEKVEVPDDFWEFFDGGKATEHAEVDNDGDFFGKRGDEIEGMKRFEKKGNPYMSDTPLVDASELKKNDSSKLSNMYMKSAEVSDASKLRAKDDYRMRDYMGSTKAVDASDLKANEKGKAWNIMGGTKMANADELEAAKTSQRSGSMMAQADRAVQAMPKKAKTYNDEIDAIELPEEMKAKKTAKKTAEIPGLPEI